MIQLFRKWQSVTISIVNLSICHVTISSASSTSDSLDPGSNLDKIIDRLSCTLTTTVYEIITLWSQIEESTNTSCIVKHLLLLEHGSICSKSPEIIYAFNYLS